MYTIHTLCTLFARILTPGIMLLIFNHMGVAEPSKQYTHDLIILGVENPADGMGKLTTTTTNYLKNKFNVLVLNCLGNQVTKETTESLYGKVILCTAQPRLYTSLPKGDIVLAYSVFESSLIPPFRVEFFNTHCDAVIVPDEYLVKVCHDSGVTIPIFVLPHGFFLEKFIAQAGKSSFNTPFVFGMSGTFWHERKNHELLIRSFFKAFKNNMKVRLAIHSSGPDNDLCKSCKTLIKKSKTKNIRLMVSQFSDSQYIDFLKSLDCYVLVSSGEGYSLTPREALALGIPCILSNTTGHRTICKSGYVLGVECSVPNPAPYPWEADNPVGLQYSPTEEAITEALLEVYNNKRKYLALAQQAKPWLTQYTDKILAPKFLTLIQPAKIILGDKNEITDDYIMTTSSQLYEKYKAIKL